MTYTNILKPFILLLLIFLTQCQQSPQFPEQTPVTYGTVFKMFHEPTNKWLHTHEIRFPRIGGFSVSGYHLDDLGNYWQILQEYPYQTKTYEDIVKCGDVVRLTSVIIGYSLRLDQTSFGLTTELLPLVHGSIEQIDSAVNWKLVCQEKENGETLFFEDKIKLKHSVTGKYVALDPSSQYTEFNCGRGCEIMRQVELHGIDDGTLDEQILFKIKGGIKFGIDEKINEE